MFKRIAVIIVVLFALTLPATAAEWSIDKAHSSVGFAVKHLVISKTKGSFGEFSGAVHFDEANWEKSSVEMTVSIASIFTDDEKRDGHLRSPEFFDAEKYPTMNFKSTTVAKGKGDTFTIVGELTIRDVTKTVTFDCEFSGVVKDPWGNTRAGFSAKTVLNRQDFNVSWSKTLDTGGLVVGNDVTVTLEIEAIQNAVG
jgi:polyisoprenoid-binding protein YceI